MHSRSQNIKLQNSKTRDLGGKKTRRHSYSSLGDNKEVLTQILPKQKRGKRLFAGNRDQSGKQNNTKQKQGQRLFDTKHSHTTTNKNGLFVLNVGLSRELDGHFVNALRGIQFQHNLLVVLQNRHCILVIPNGMFFLSLGRNGYPASRCFKAASVSSALRGFVGCFWNGTRNTVASAVRSFDHRACCLKSFSLKLPCFVVINVNKLYKYVCFVLFFCWFYQHKGFPLLPGFLEGRI